MQLQVFVALSAHCENVVVWLLVYRLADISKV
jgi:hypothetical protein